MKRADEFLQNNRHKKACKMGKRNLKEVEVGTTCDDEPVWSLRTDNELSGVTVTLAQILRSSRTYNQSLNHFFCCIALICKDIASLEAHTNAEGLKNASVYMY